MDKRTLALHANRPAIMQALQAAQNAQACRHLQLSRRGLVLAAETKGKTRRAMGARAALTRHPRRPTGWTMNLVRGHGCTYRHAPHRSLWVHLSAGGVRRAVTIALPPPTFIHPHPRPSPSFHLHVLLPRTPGHVRVCHTSVFASVRKTYITRVLPDIPGLLHG